jgi:hypothetical protein
LELELVACRRAAEDFDRKIFCTPRFHDMDDLVFRVFVFVLPGLEPALALALALLGVVLVLAGELKRDG